MKCQLEKIKIHYESFGVGTPILMLPGWGMSGSALAKDWEPIFESHQGWQRIYLDLPGHGKTEGPDWIENMNDILQVVLDFIDEVIPNQHFLIGSLSLGSYLARGVLHHKFPWINGLLMVVPLIIADDDQRNVPAHQVLIEEPGIMDDLSQEEKEMFNYLTIRSRKFLDILRASSPLEDEFVNYDFLVKIRQNPKNYSLPFNVDQLPQPFVKPTLIVAGRQDSMVGYQDAWKIVENYPRASFILLDRSGHFLEEKQSMLKILIHEWLDRILEYSTVSQTHSRSDSTEERESHSNLVEVEEKRET